MPTILSEELDELLDWLDGNGYETVDDWAWDSDYWYDKRHDTWYSEDGDPVDILTNAYHAMEADDAE